MVNSSKTLEISYGDYSCTLEGFGNSFKATKAITEYFRSLSADDKYFDTKPAQQDTQTLAKIAEREIQKPVEAIVRNNGILLRVSTADNMPNSTPQPVANENIEQLAKAAIERNTSIDLGIGAMMRTDRAERTMGIQGGEDAISRLMDETDAKLNAVESTRNRSGFSQLRGAVEATKSDREIETSRRAPNADDAANYRSDLADVVSSPIRPTRVRRNTFG